MDEFRVLFDPSVKGTSADFEGVTCLLSTSSLSKEFIPDFVIEGSLKPCFLFRCRNHRKVKVFRSQGLPPCANDAAVEHISKLADVSWPGVLHQPFQRAFRHSCLMAKAQQKMLTQHLHICGSVAKGRNLKLQDAQPVVEVFSKFSTQDAIP